MNHISEFIHHAGAFQAIIRMALAALALFLAVRFELWMVKRLFLFADPVEDEK